MMNFNWVDISLLVILLMSCSIGIMRGLAREFLSLAAWIIAIWFSVVFCYDFADYILPYSHDYQTAVYVSFALIFILVLFVSSLINFVIFQAIKLAGLSLADRVLGLFFGLIRGTLIICLFILVGRYMSLSQASWWQEARLIGYFEDIATYIDDYLPFERKQNKK